MSTSDNLASHDEWRQRSSLSCACFTSMHFRSVAAIRHNRASILSSSLITHRDELWSGHHVLSEPQHPMLKAWSKLMRALSSKCPILDWVLPKQYKCSPWKGLTCRRHFRSDEIERKACYHNKWFLPASTDACAPSRGSCVWRVDHLSAVQLSDNSMHADNWVRIYEQIIASASRWRDNERQKRFSPQEI